MKIIIGLSVEEEEEVTLQTSYSSASTVHQREIQVHIKYHKMKVNCNCSATSNRHLHFSNIMQTQFAVVQTRLKNIVFTCIWRICHSRLDGTDDHVAI